MSEPTTMRGLAAKWREETAATSTDEYLDPAQEGEGKKLALSKSADELDALADALGKRITIDKGFDSWMRREIIGERQ